MSLTLVDSHCHLDDHKFDVDRTAAIERALTAGCKYLVSIGTGEGPPDFTAGIRMAESHPQIFATVGIHPEHAAKASAEDLERIRELTEHRKVIAVGEIGLDYYWQPVARDEQHRVFIEQMKIASAVRKPVVLHTRDAWDDTFTLLEQHWDFEAAPCVLHCFTGSPAIADRALTLGCYLSFGGVTTYPKATEVHESAQLVPLDRMLLETDSPYLAPAPHRGKRNEPSFVRHTADRIAELRSIEVEELGAATTRTFERVFGLPR